MSYEGLLTEEDEQLLEHIDEQIESAETPEEYTTVLREIRAEFAKFRAEVRQEWRSIEQRLDALEREADVPDRDAPPIEHYANIPESDREELLSTSDRIAVTLHIEWDAIAWNLGGGRNVHGDMVSSKIGVDTKTTAEAKYSPSRLRHRLRTVMGEDFEARQLYRGLKHLAKLSGGEELVEEDTGRVRIVGGLYEFRERPTADNQDVKKVLWEAA